MQRAEAQALPAVSRTLSGWGGGAGAAARVLRPDGVEAARAAVEQCRNELLEHDLQAGAIARGMGRSYGDAAQRSGGYVLDMTALKGFELDEDAATVTAWAGTTLGELIAALVPSGWMLPVVPGTQHVTVAGAIASDIHGKNHGNDGTFGAHVQALGLLTASGEVLDVGPDSSRDVFTATLGGMGLTGVIVWARFGLQRIHTAMMAVDSDRVDDLDAAMSLLAAPGRRYRVAWLDLLGSRPGRGVVTRAEHIEVSEHASPRLRRRQATVRAAATVPERWPGQLLRAGTVRAYNALRFHRTPRSETGKPEALGTHLFPLDVLDAWPRLYGPRGFFQYQLVVPVGAERAIHDVVGHLRRSGVPCYLAVLKDMGPANDAPLSFPIAGWTLALDLPRAASGVERLLDSFDEIVAGAGGRVYLAKDARMRPATVAEMYPRLAEWQSVRDTVDPERVWRSDLALRTGLIGVDER